eukprot:scaffold99617_cov28-Prasinocladus_malaysianus.AAC.2
MAPATIIQFVRAALCASLYHPCFFMSANDVEFIIVPRAILISIKLAEATLRLCSKDMMEEE